MIDFSLISYDSTSCLAIIDSGTSGIGIPGDEYDSIVSVITNGMSCEDLLCSDVSYDDFPVIMISLQPDNKFPLLPTDYLDCDG